MFLIQLPTLDDVREQMMKLAVEKLKVGQLVDICAMEGAPPKFSSGPQIRTFGLTGEVLQVSKWKAINNWLIQILPNFEILSFLRQF